MTRVWYLDAYYLRDGWTWVEEASGKRVNSDVKKQLNELYFDSAVFHRTDPPQELEMGLQAMACRCYPQAMQLFERVCEYGGRKLAAKAVSGFMRSANLAKMPDKALAFLTENQKLFGEIVITPESLTAAADAYYQLGDYPRSRRCADRAFAAAGKELTPELSLLYAQLGAVDETLRSSFPQLGEGPQQESTRG